MGLGLAWSDTVDFKLKVIPRHRVNLKSTVSHYREFKIIVDFPEIE